MKHPSIAIAIIALLVSPLPAEQQDEPEAPRQPHVQSADEVLRQMLRPPGPATRPLEPVTEPPAPDRTTGPGAVAPGAPMLTVLPERTLIIDRAGRLTRTADEQMQFTFDADGRTMRDPPMIILPNRNLLRMEHEAASATRDLRFRITGMVTEYRGRNYILIEKAEIIPDTVQQF